MRVRVVYDAYPAVAGRQAGQVGGQAPARRVGLARAAREVQRRQRAQQRHVRPARRRQHHQRRQPLLLQVAPDRAYTELFTLLTRSFFKRLFLKNMTWLLFIHL